MILYGKLLGGLEVKLSRDGGVVCMCLEGFCVCLNFCNGGGDGEKRVK